MAASKSRNKKNTPNQVFGGKNPITGPVGTAILAVFFIVGQALWLKGAAFLGMGLSLLAALVWLAGYFDVFNPRFDFKETSSKPFKNPPIKGAGKSSFKLGEVKPFFNAMDFYRLLAILASLMLAAMGQSYWIQMDRPATLAIGAFYYLGAVLLWLGALGPWFKEGPAESIKVLSREKALFWGVMALAFFMRVSCSTNSPRGFSSTKVMRVIRPCASCMRDGIPSMWRTSTTITRWCFTRSPLSSWWRGRPTFP